jgi:hypothetical protein
LGINFQDGIWQVEVKPFVFWQQARKVGFTAKTGKLVNISDPEIAHEELPEPHG